MNRLLLIGLLAELIFSFSSYPTACQSLKVNEVQYSNRQSYFDSEGDTPDWIELINNGNSAVNLDGYRLSDDPDETDPWRLPDYLLQPDSFFVVFASGKDLYLENEYHTDFKLKLMREPVILLDQNGNILDKIDIQCVPPEKSLGRWQDTSDNLMIMTPTPGYSNKDASTQEIHFLQDTIEISHESGAYKGPLHINLTNTHAQNTIVYTLDGEIPDERSEQWDGDLILEDINAHKNRFAKLADSKYETGDLISKGNILRAVVLSEGCPASQEIVKTYFVNQSGSIPYMVPVVSLITEKDNLFDDEIGIYVAGKHINFSKHGKAWERPVHVEIIDTTGTPILSQHAGMRIHGAGSRQGDQKSLRLYAREAYGVNVFEPIHFEQKPTINSFKTLLLRVSKGWSRTLYKDEMCHQLVQDMALDYCATQTSIVFINGEYWGIYSLRERQDKYYVENNYDINEVELDIIGFKPNGIELEEGTIDSYEELMQHLKSFDPKSDHAYSDLNRWFDLDNLIDFYIAQLYFANSDFPQNNFEMWKVRSDTAKWRFFFYDLDGAMIRTFTNHLGSFNNDFENLSQYPDHTLYIIRRLLENVDFRQKFRAQFIHHLETTFSPDRVLTIIDQYNKLYTPLVSEHIYRWNYPADLIKWYHNVNMLKDFAVQRPYTLYDQLENNFRYGINVFPNPSRGIFNIDLGDYTGDLNVKILTVDGIVVHSQYLYGTKTISMCPNLEPGLYMLQLILGQECVTQKLIIN